MGKNNLHCAICFYAQEVHVTSVPGQGPIINLKQKVHHTRYAPLTPSRKRALHAPRNALPPVAAPLLSAGVNKEKTSIIGKVYNWCCQEDSCPSPLVTPELQYPPPPG